MRPRSRRKSLLVVATTLVLAFVVLALAGPRARVNPTWVEPPLPADTALVALEAWVASVESGVPALRAGDGRGILWADPDAPARTPLSIAYLHGYSADRHEIEPVVSDLGRRLGANVYFTRLAGHGRDGPAMAEATAERWLADAAEALAVGGRLGERVVVVGTSTGGTLATWLAQRPEAAGRLAAIVLISPNFQPRDRSSRVLLLPWGARIARLAVGPERCFDAENEAQARHWTTCYPTRSLAPMMALVEYVRTSDVSSVRVPTLVLYSPEDAVVDPDETLRVVGEMSGTTPVVHEVVSTSDPGHHVLAGDILSTSSNEEVIGAILEFLERNPDP